MKVFFKTVVCTVIMFMCSMFSYALDVDKLKTHLENRIAITKCEVQTCKVKLKIDKQNTLLNNEYKKKTSELKLLKTQLKTVSTYINTANQSDKLTKKLNKVNDKLNTLNQDVKHIADTENYK